MADGVCRPICGDFFVMLIEFVLFHYLLSFLLIYLQWLSLIA